jgi:hypothetical protein
MRILKERKNQKAGSKVMEFANKHVVLTLPPHPALLNALAPQPLRVFLHFP